jgi:hypothetical protein
VPGVGCALVQLLRAFSFKLGVDKPHNRSYNVYTNLEKGQTMKNLQDYIDNRNSWNSFFPNSTTITFPLSQKNVDDLAGSLDSDLSPENLHCDGEISQAEAQRKYNYYGRVIKDLENYCLKNWLNTPTVYEY